MLFSFIDFFALGKHYLTLWLTFWYVIVLIIRITKRLLFFIIVLSRYILLFPFPSLLQICLMYCMWKIFLWINCPFVSCCRWYSARSAVKLSTVSASHQRSVQKRISRRTGAAGAANSVTCVAVEARAQKYVTLMLYSVFSYRFTLFKVVLNSTHCNIEFNIYTCYNHASCSTLAFKSTFII